MATTTVATGRKIIKDTTAADIVNISGDATAVTIAGSMKAGDIINIEGLASEYTVSAIGRTITLKSATQTIKFQLAATAGSASVRFLDGDLTATYANAKAGATLGGVKLTRVAKDIDDSKLGATDASAVDFTGSAATGGGSTGGGSTGGGSTTTTGQVFTLTTNIDVSSGTSGNDTFIGEAAAILSADQVSGGNGTDTMKIYSLAAATDVPTLSGVEIVELYDAAAPGNALDLSSVTEMTTLVLDNATTTDNYTIGAAVATTVRGMADGESVTLTSTATDATADITITNMGTIAGAGVTINADGAAIKTINLVSSGTVAAGTDSDVTLASTGTETAVNVSGSGDLAISGLNASVVTLNAASFSGNLTATLGATTTTTAITSAAGNDKITATAAVDYNISLGGGNDVLTIADAAGELTVNDTISGGDGSADVLAISSAEAENLDDGTAADTAVLARVTGFEILRVTDAIAGAIDLTALGYNHLQATTALGADRTLTVGSNFTFESRLAGNIGNDYIISMTGASAAGSNSDTITLRMNADLTENDARTASFDLAGINIVNIQALDSGSTVADTDGSGDEGYTIDLAGATAGNSASIKTVNISGTQAVSYTVNAATTALETIDGSAVTTTSGGVAGNLTIDATAYVGLQGLVIKGGGGLDTLTGSAGLGDLITGGAGADTINGLTGSDILTGGAGADSFNFTVAASYTGGAPSATVFEEITDYQKGVDIINETAAAFTISTDASTASTVAGTAALSLTTGIATFNGADDTLAEKIAAVNAALAAGTEATNQIAIFEHSGSTYVYVYEDTADTVAALDGLIKLTGITGISSVDLTTSTGNLILS